MTTGHKSSLELPPALAAVLEPFITYSDWTLHYPLYVNTFCFAHHVATLLKIRCGPDALRERFIRHDWKCGPPGFTYRTGVEIFVGVEETKKTLERRGHYFPIESQVTFTGYNMRSVFYRLDRPNDGPALLITDDRRNAEKLLKIWHANPPDIDGFGRVDLKPKDIRDSSERGLHDFFVQTRKVYLFSAPTAGLLQEQASTKYKEVSITTDPIVTAYLFRKNSGASPQMIADLREAVQKYYQLIYDRTQTTSLISSEIPRHYGRLANSCGEPNPFPEALELQREGDRRVPSATTDTLLLKRYIEILHSYHKPPAKEHL